MISLEAEKKALEEWALNELKQVGQRGFEFSKFFFGISAGSFAIFPFFDMDVSLANVWQCCGLLVLGASTLVAIKMADPADFKILDDTSFSEEHEKYANRTKGLRNLWIKMWLPGIFLVFIGMTFDLRFSDLMSFIHG